MASNLTNRKFAKENGEFLQACNEANIEPSTRQASKYRNEKGKAYKTKRHGYLASS